MAPAFLWFDASSALKITAKHLRSGALGGHESSHVKRKQPEKLGHEERLPEDLLLDVEAATLNHELLGLDDKGNSILHAKPNKLQRPALGYALILTWRDSDIRDYRREAAEVKKTFLEIRKWTTITAELTPQHRGADVSDQVRCAYQVAARLAQEDERRYGCKVVLTVFHHSHGNFNPYTGVLSLSSHGEPHGFEGHWRWWDLAPTLMSGDELPVFFVLDCCHAGAAEMPDSMAYKTAQDGQAHRGPKHATELLASCHRMGASGGEMTADLCYVLSALPKGPVSTYDLYYCVWNTMSWRQNVSPPVRGWLRDIDGGIMLP
ncbi:hypothetical protein QBC47DRAFT_363067 [Echria macrotheca]|uniref:Uncharacterized protein n=1 Tax=Echria macrotheca TaxID=438768 RepID=A0AAJ0B7S5_9PEZI|nr:hypothetical protein QBC47DRAFT_363067 [Echria macrotheca]